MITKIFKHLFFRERLSRDITLRYIFNRGYALLYKGHEIALFETKHKAYSFYAKNNEDFFGTN